MHTLGQIAPDRPLCWHGAFDPTAGGSCRILPVGGAAAAATAAGAGAAAAPAAAAAAGAVAAAGGGTRGAAAAAALAECNAGGEMLQSFLDGLGALNTFG